MTITNWITLTSALIVAIGWFVTAYHNRKKDIAAKRLEHRLTALKSFLPVWFAIQKSRAPFQDPKFLPLLEEARSNILLYGLSDEMEPMESFVSSVEKGDLEQAKAALTVLVPRIRERIRRELEIS